MSKRIAKPILFNPDKDRADAVRRPFVYCESIACFYCDCDSPDDLEAAFALGWESIEYDDGQGWNYLGVCPHCQEVRKAQP